MEDTDISLWTDHFPLSHGNRSGAFLCLSYLRRVSSTAGEKLLLLIFEIGRNINRIHRCSVQVLPSSGDRRSRTSSLS
jgi:hypothetical protein